MKKISVKYIALLPYTTTDLKAAVKQGFVSVAENGHITWIAKPHTRTRTFAQMRTWARKGTLYRVGTQIIAIQP